MNFDQNFPADGVVDFEHAVRGSEDDFDVRQARFEHVLVLFNNHSERFERDSRERIVFKSALDDENARKFAAGRGGYFLFYYQTRTHSLSRSLSSSATTWLEFFFSVLPRERERQRDRDRDRERVL